MIQEDINPYNSETFKSFFKTTSTYEHIYKNHDVISFSEDLDIIFNLRTELLKTDLITSRRELTFSIFDAVPFYHIQYLLDLNPTNIYDIGCGCNVFKKYIPNIIGIDVPQMKSNIIKNTADIYDPMDDSFFEKNFEKFESAFSICALHFYPFSKIRERVIQFSSLISKGGRGFIGLNAVRMLEAQFNLTHDASNFKSISTEKLEQIELFIRKKLYNLPFEIEVFECTISTQFNNYLNGNIRIVFTK
jgi:hypothetical protein